MPNIDDDNFEIMMILYRLSQEPSTITNRAKALVMVSRPRRSELEQIPPRSIETWEAWDILRYPKSHVAARVSTS